MTEACFVFGGARVMRASRAPGLSTEALVLFPGFPGYAPVPGSFSGPGPKKLRVELAKAVLAALDLDVYLPGYEGLDGAKAFRFERTLSAGSELAAGLLGRGYRRLHVGGHSWGAFVAFNAHRALGREAGRLALLSGVLDLPDEGAVRAFLPYYLSHFPEVLGSGQDALERAAQDLDAARRVGNPLTHAVPLAEPALLIVHGRQDAEVSVEVSRRFHGRAGGRLVELDADHGYTGNAAAVVGELVGFLARD